MPNFTKTAIKITFLRLLNQKPLDKISVKDIVEECGVNRNTFYYHYQDIPQLIEEIMKDEADTLISKYPSIKSFDECMTVAFKFILENKKAVNNILNSSNRKIYEKYNMNLCEYVVTKYFDNALGESDLSERDRKTVICFFKSAIYGLSVEWIQNGMKEDAYDMIEGLSQMCSGISEAVVKSVRKN